MGNMQYYGCNETLIEGYNRVNRCKGSVFKDSKCQAAIFFPFLAIWLTMTYGVQGRSWEIVIPMSFTYIYTLLYIKAHNPRLIVTVNLQQSNL